MAHIAGTVSRRHFNQEMAEMKRLIVRLSLYHDTSVMREVGLVMCNHVVHLKGVMSLIGAIDLIY
jgi:hypothetical protein